MYTAAKELIWHPQENPSGWAAPKFIREKCFDFSANDWQVNDDLLAEYKATFEPKKSNIEAWENTSPEKTEKFDYGTEFVYGQTDSTDSSTMLDDVIYGDDKFKYGNNYTYGSETVDKPDVLQNIQPFEPEQIIRPQFDYGNTIQYGNVDTEQPTNGDYWFNNAYTYGNVDTEDEVDEVSDSIDDFTNTKIDYDSEYEQYIYNQSYLYGLEAEQVKNSLTKEDDILDIINFTDVETPINNEDFITTFDKFMFGNVYTYGTENNEITDDEPNNTKFNYGDDFKYGD